MLGLQTDQYPITLSWGQLIAAHWSVCWPAGVAAVLVFAVTSSLWELDEVYAQFTFLGLLYNAVYLVVQAAILPRLFKKNYRSFFLATVDPAGNISRSVPIPLFRALALRLILTQVALTGVISFSASWIGIDGDFESVRRFSTLIHYAQIVVIGPAVLHFALQAKASNSAISAFSAHR